MEYSGSYVNSGYSLGKMLALSRAEVKRSSYCHTLKCCPGWERSALTVEAFNKRAQERLDVILGK